MKFTDEIEIRVKGGHGGAGSVHFMREKYKEMGGPDGGDGGKGGDVILQAHGGTQTLGHFNQMQVFRAPKGEDGRGKNCSGANAENITLRVPLGTTVLDSDSLEEIGDLIHDGDTFIVAKGGKGGLGNQHFVNSVNQAPHYAQPGIAGEDRVLILKLKLLADVGLIGLPNAGKSTLLDAVSRSHPKIADYAFTTLVPNLGVVENQDSRRFLLADIPGIIEGAHRGIGLGLSFLRHIERVEVMVYVIDASSMQPAEDLKMLRAELASYSEKLLERSSLVVLNKMDLADYDDEMAEEIAETLRDPEIWGKSAVPGTVFISAMERKGLDELIDKIFKLLPEATFAETMLRGHAVV
jgi:GTPase